MRRIVVTGIVSLLLVIWLATGGTSYLRSAIAAGGSREPESHAVAPKQDNRKSNAEELLGLEKRRQQLMEKEAALAAKEQEINRAATALDNRIKELSAAQKTFEDALNEKKRKDAEYASERYRKMLKILKGMKPEESAKIVDKLEENMAIGVLNQLDQKTVIKMARFLGQPRLVKWVRENLEIK
jgi:flagellar motility protein MotE (MotC chaperone)